MTDICDPIEIKLRSISGRKYEESIVAASSIGRTVRYEGGRMRVPEFLDVSTVWLRHIKIKSDLFCAEIREALSIDNSKLSKAQVSRLTTFIENEFRDSNYVDHLSSFSEVVIRAAQSYGTKVDLEHYGFSACNAAFKAAATNSLTSARATLGAEIKLHSLQEESKLEAANEMLELKPNIMGFGFNLNAMIKRLLRKSSS